MGQPCGPNSYRFMQSFPLPNSWGDFEAQHGGEMHPALLDPLFLSEASSRKASRKGYMAFDVHPLRGVYAYCMGHSIFTYNYSGSSKLFLDFAYLPEPCSDIRFTASGR